MQNNRAQDVIHALQQKADPDKALFLSRFFKTGKGDYAEGDIFLGLKVPDTRKIALEYKEIADTELEKLLHSDLHEVRLAALIIMVAKVKKADDKVKKKLYDLYLKNTEYVNNWDLVDLSAEHIIGGYLIHHPEEIKILKQLAASDLIWDRRIAVLSTFQFIKNGSFKENFEIAEILLTDKHDLIHKAVGWLLREIGKKISPQVEEEFLLKHYKKMPRTMLRYAIEHFPPNRRSQYLKGEL